MDPRLEQRLSSTRRRRPAGIGIGAAALGELLNQDLCPVGELRCRGWTSRFPALRAEGQARDLSIPGRWSFPARSLGLQTGLEKLRKTELPDSVRNDMPTAMTANQTSHSIAPTIFKLISTASLEHGSAS